MTTPDANELVLFFLRCWRQRGSPTWIEKAAHMGKDSCGGRHAIGTNTIKQQEVRPLREPIWNTSASSFRYNDILIDPQQRRLIFLEEMRRECTALLREEEK